MRDASEAVDLAEAAIPLLQYDLPMSFFTSLTDQVDRQVAEQERFLSGTHIYSGSTSASNSSGTAFVLSQHLDTRTLLAQLPPQERGPAAGRLERLDAVVNRLADKDRAIHLMREFNLGESSSGVLSPVVLLETAHAAFGAPAGAQDQALTSHIPARQAVGETLERLLKRAHTQEKTGNVRAKITFICNQLGRRDLDQERMRELADRGHTLQDELSGSKDKVRTRDEARTLLNMATLFIVELLGMLDPSRTA